MATTRRGSTSRNKPTQIQLGLYQCTVCNEVCEEEGSGGKGGDSIECFMCQKWTHSKCTKLAKSHIELLQTGGDQVQFTCTSCAPGKGAQRKDPILTKLDMILRLLDHQEKRLKDIEEATQDLEPQTIDSKIEKAVEKKLNEMAEEQQEKERIRLNLVISNIPESQEEGTEARIIDDLMNVRKKIEDIAPGTPLATEVYNPIRLGRYEAGKPPRPIKFTCRTEDAKKFILQNARKIKQTVKENKKKIWINNDLTRKEREAGKALRDELKRRTSAGETDLVIRSGKIVKKIARQEGAGGAAAQGGVETETVGNANTSTAQVRGETGTVGDTEPPKKVGSNSWE